MSRAQNIINYWLGNVEKTVLPTENRTKIWFGHSKEVDEEINELFGSDIEKAINGEYDDWDAESRGSLALIILFDQFSRRVFRGTAKAFAQDQRALDLCLRGIQKQYDHALSLIERVFFYAPLMHSEDGRIQATSVRAYQTLVELSFPETRSLFENFLDYANKRYDVIQRFHRFPQRNELLDRKSTVEELEFMRQQ